ncbi:MAG: methyltransferase, partial [candidate division NC10 bacterium]|nr:methyltransferase [candidate division NC10 bacterium]
DRISVLTGDWRDVPSLFPPCSFDLVFANPPYRSVGTGKVSPRSEVFLAKHMAQGGWEALLKAAAWALRAKGMLCLIYHADGLVSLMACLRQAHLEPKSLRLVHSFVGSEAEFALVSARREGREGLKVLPPLILYSRKGNRPTPELEAIYGSFRPAPEGNLS